MSQEELSQSSGLGDDLRHPEKKKTYSQPQMTKRGNLFDVTQQAGSAMAGIKVGSIFITSTDPD